ncbi:RNA polymerase sigma factor [Edaphovirga cremea]|uniref:RNA polymerase sigma factor n=1 Tax=Edaphovirga cremea TaxID=2267246 RepID=UPI003989A492
MGQYLARLWRYGMVLARNQDVANDLVQATCVRALERIEQFDHGTHLDRWLFTILHSVWVNEIRSQHIRQGQGFVDIDDLPPASERNESFESISARQIIERVNQLPEAQRNAVFLVYVEGFTYQEAAETLSVPIGTIMSRLTTARQSLAKDSVIMSARPQIQGESS